MHTLSCTHELIKTESDSQRRGARTMALNIDVMKGQGSTESQERKRWRETDGERVQRGNMGRSKGYFRVNPLLDCLRAGGCQQAWEQTDKYDAGTGLHAKLCCCTHTNTLLSVYTGRQTRKHIIITDEYTKINVINMLAPEEITCFLSNLHPSFSCISASFIPHTYYRLRPKFRVL